MITRNSTTLSNACSPTEDSTSTSMEGRAIGEFRRTVCHRAVCLPHLYSTSTRTISQSQSIPEASSTLMILLLPPTHLPLKKYNLVSSLPCPTWAHTTKTIAWDLTFSRHRSVPFTSATRRLCEHWMWSGIVWPSLTHSTLWPVSALADWYSLWFYAVIYNRNTYWYSLGFMQ